MDLQTLVLYVEGMSMVLGSPSLFWGSRTDGLTNTRQIRGPM